MGNVFRKSPGAVNNGFSAPTGDATWTKYTDNATTAAELVMQDAGYAEFELNGTTYRLPVYTAT